MKKLWTLTLLMLAVLCYGQERFLTGKISDGKNPLDNVTIKNLNREIATTSDVEGRYKIEVETGDKIEYSYMGMKTVSIKIEDVTRILNPVMYLEVNELEEVKIIGNKLRTQKELERDFIKDEFIIKTAFGYLDKNTSPFRVQVLSKSQWSDANQCILDILRGRFPNVQVTGTCQQGGGAIIRGLGSIVLSNSAIFDVDGIIFREAPVWIAPQLIERIAVLPGQAGAAQYGSLSANGIIVVNTINLFQTLKEKRIDHAILTNNFENGKILTQEEIYLNEPNYLKQLKNSETFEKSKEIFSLFQKSYSSSPYFILDSYTFFIEQHNAMDFADGLIESNFYLFENNPVLLKALAYVYDHQGRKDKSQQVNKEIFILRPNYTQSYLDMANSYRDNGNVKKAASIFSRFEYLMSEGFMKPDTIAMGKTMFREYNNLLKLHKEEIVKDDIARKLYVVEDDQTAIRLVFEWNDGEAEFDLQFVNPKNQYYLFKHTLIDNEELINVEKDFGFSTHEEFLDNSLPGIWHVNATYYGNKSLSPTYLKVSIYNNYGTPQQKKEIKTFKLLVKNANQKLFSLNVGSALIVNKTES